MSDTGSSPTSTSPILPAVSLRTSGRESTRLPVPLAAGEFDEPKVLAAIAAGDPGAYEALDRRFRQRLAWLARAAGIPAQDCEDVVQETLAAACDQLRRGLFRQKSSLGTWLEVLLRGKIVDYRRSPGKRSLSADWALHQFTEIENSPSSLEPCVLPSPDLVLGIREVIAKLPARHRMVLLMSVSEGLTIAEISRCVGWPPGSVGRILAEAKNMFRNAINEF